jgi:chorismate synthase
MFRFLTCGESHGKMLAGILEGLPAGLEILESEINLELKRRQQGYGRGDRMQSIETDTVQIISGVRWGLSTGSPIGLLIENKDWVNRQKEMSIHKEDINSKAPITRPRPGHADLAGMLKYNIQDATPILERASARNTASQVAVGAICQKFLKELGVEILAYVQSIGNVSAENLENSKNEKIELKNIEKFKQKIEASQVRCLDEKASEKMIQHINEMKEKGDTLGGKICVNIFGVVVGIGSHIQYDKRLDSGLAQAMMGIPSVKSVVIGDENVSEIAGTKAHDPIVFSPEKSFHHTTNNAGGIEGGMSNGETITLTIGLKPIPTLLSPLPSVDIKTKEIVKAATVRSDVAVAPSAVVVAEAMVAIKLTEFYLEKFGSDSMLELKTNLANYKKQITT